MEPLTALEIFPSALGFPGGSAPQDTRDHLHGVTGTELHPEGNPNFFSFCPSTHKLQLILDPTGKNSLLNLPISWFLVLTEAKSELIL